MHENEGEGGHTIGKVGARVGGRAHEEGGCTRSTSSSDSASTSRDTMWPPSLPPFIIYLVIFTYKYVPNIF